MGLVGFMNTLKLEGGKYNIKVNTVAPVAASRLTEDVMPPDMFAKLQPDFIAPLVLYLSSEECQDTGSVFNAAAGFYNRAAMITGPGTLLGDGVNPPSIENIRDNWDKINSMEGAKEYMELNAAIMTFLMPPAPAKAEEAKGGGGSALDVKGIFAKMPEAFNADKAAGKDLVFQFSISGAGGGEWSATIKGGTLKVEEGKAASPTTTIKMADQDFIALITGKLDGMKAFSEGKLKVEGDMMKSQLIGKLFTFKL
jgi:putative sterol carrier protein